MGRLRRGPSGEMRKEEEGGRMSVGVGLCDEKKAKEYTHAASFVDFYGG